jgi:hypothetical protein
MQGTLRKLSRTRLHTRFAVAAVSLNLSQPDLAEVFLKFVM